MKYLEKEAAITGIGVSDVGRPVNRSGLALTVDACLQAIADAGLNPEDIDVLGVESGIRDGLKARVHGQCESRSVDRAPHVGDTDACDGGLFFKVLHDRPSSGAKKGNHTSSFCSKATRTD